MAETPLHSQLSEDLQAILPELYEKPYRGRVYRDALLIGSRGLRIGGGGAQERLLAIMASYSATLRNEEVQRQFQIVDQTPSAVRHLMHNGRKVTFPPVVSITGSLPSPIKEALAEPRDVSQIEVIEGTGDYSLSYIGGIPVTCSQDHEKSVIRELSSIDYVFLRLLGGSEIFEPDIVLSGCALIHDRFLDDNYSHWLLDWFPRLHLLKKAGADLTSLTYILPHPLSPFRQETLAKLGIEPRQIISLPSPISRAKLTARTSNLWGATSSGPSFRHSLHNGQRWAADFIRSTVLGGAPPRTRRLILNRRGSRRFVYDAAADEFLRAKGFQEVFAEGLSVSAQADMFASAEMLIGAHGAGLANIVFCQPETPVLEIFSPSLASVAFHHAARASDLRYTCGVAQLSPTLAKVPSYQQDLLLTGEMLNLWWDTL